MCLWYFQGIDNLELEIENFIFAPRESEKQIIELTCRYESLEMQSVPPCSRYFHLSKKKRKKETIVN